MFCSRLLSFVLFHFKTSCMNPCLALDTCFSRFVERRIYFLAYLHFILQTRSVVCEHSLDGYYTCSGWSSYQLDGTCEQQDPLGRPRQADNQIEARLLSFMCPTVELRILKVERDEWPCWSSSPTQADDVEFTYEPFYFIQFFG